MELLRRWALVLCVCAVLASVLQSVLPQKGACSVIKLVLALSILVTLISPLQQFSAVEFSFAPPAAVQPAAADLTGTVLKRAGDSLGKTLTAAFAGAGLNVSGVEVALVPDAEQGAAVRRVTVHSQDDAQKLRACAQQALGCEAPLTVVREDGMTQTWN